ncbi:uncharacterized protein LOC126335325 [Schistocerca gregaria]|uniref:uncharacterized protein LOC126335325 n=1 Tax=Schistocerca gregaria TaxID=7010 RepID=UPI00211F2AD3|nr:uncharacterized protein LOC126335325 [Schistocerca gregaria]
MKRDICAIFFHKSSTDEKPCHGLVPSGENSWCKYNRAQATGESYSHQHSLPAAVITAIKPIFRDLARPDLVRKCLHGQRQNPNECFNSIIWNHLPKTVFVGMHTMKLGVHGAVITFCCGNIGKCWVLKKLGINPGENMITGLQHCDKMRITDANRSAFNMAKKARQTSRKVKKELEDQLEAKEGPSHAAGQF